MTQNDKQLEARVAELEETVERLTDVIGRLGDGRARSAGATPPERPVDRRTMLRMAAAAAGGAVVAPLATAGPVAAANGDPVVIGTVNTTTPGDGRDTVLEQTPTAGGEPTRFHVRRSAAAGPSPDVSTNAPLWGTGAANEEGVLGWCPGDEAFGVYGATDSGFAVVGQSGTGVDLLAFGAGRVAQVPAFAANGNAPPYEATLFETVRDDRGVVWLSGTPETGGTWRRANSVIPIAPLRVWDSRNPGGAPTVGVAPPPGALQGPFNAVTTVTLSLGGYQGLPVAISGLVCVLTVITPTSGGFLKAFPGGAAAPLAVVGNFTAGAIVSFYPTVATGTAGAQAGRLSVQVAAGTGVQVGLDVTAYLV